MFMRYLKIILLCILIGVIWGGAFSRAQTAESPIRIAGTLDENARTLLRGNVSIIAQPRYDRGEVAGETQISRMRIILARSADQQSSLDRFERELQDKTSPNYHQWLTPETFGKQYGPAEAATLVKDLDLFRLVTLKTQLDSLVDEYRRNLKKLAIEDDGPVAPHQAALDFSKV